MAEVFIPREDLLKIRQGVFFRWEVSRMYSWSLGRRSRITQLLRIFFWHAWEFVYVQVTVPVRTMLHKLNRALAKIEHLWQFFFTEYLHRNSWILRWTSARWSTGLDQKTKQLPKTLQFLFNSDSLWPLAFEEKWRMCLPKKYLLFSWRELPSLTATSQFTKWKGFHSVLKMYRICLCWFNGQMKYQNKTYIKHQI